MKINNLAQYNPLSHNNINFNRLQSLSINKNLLKMFRLIVNPIRCHR